MIKNHLFIYSSRPSNGARELAQALQAKRLRTHLSSWVPRSHHTVINWGSSTPTIALEPARILNRPELVARSSNKLSFFKHLQSIGSSATVPEWTVEPDIARSWIGSGGVAIARTVLNGHSGNGIVVIENELDFVPAPLYTKYVKKEAEYRVHCIRTTNPGGSTLSPSYRAFDIQRKIKDPTFVGVPNWRVRNHSNGFIYVRDNIQVPEDVKVQALQAFEASGLDFGAVDVIWNASQSSAYILEINTAPGLVGRSVQSYKEAFSSALDLPLAGPVN